MAVGSPLALGKGVGTRAGDGAGFVRVGARVRERVGAGVWAGPGVGERVGAGVVHCTRDTVDKAMGIGERQCRMFCQVPTTSQTLRYLCYTDDDVGQPCVRSLGKSAENTHTQT